MDKAITTCNGLMKEFAENYMQTLFYFCLKKTGSYDDAEDLTQDIALNILAALRKGTVPICFSPWVWQIARNRYSLWAAKKHNRSQLVTGSDVSDYEIEDTHGNVFDEMVRSEELSLLRRELAFIKQDYRQILVAYYIEDISVRDIAQSLSLSVSAVQQRLHRARKILKEGMDMAREFGRLSYKPEDISFVASGPQPSGLPWSAVQRSIPKNILLFASNNPCTLEELSMELGIALPYMEEEVGILHRATLLEKQGDKYITNFFILDKNCRLKVYNALRENAKERSKLIQEFIEDMLPDIRALGIAGNHLDDNHIRWWLIPHIIDYIIVHAKKDSSYYEPPKRANGETWGFVGYELVELPESIVMGHNGMGNGSKKGCNYFWSYKINDYKMRDQCGEMSWDGVMLMGECLRNHRLITSFTDSEKRVWRGIDGKHAHANENGEIVPDILVMTDEQLNEIHRFLKEHKNYPALIENATSAYKKLNEIFQNYSHEVLHNSLDYYISAEMYTMRMMAVHDLVENGFLQLPADPKKSTLGMHFILR